MKYRVLETLLLLSKPLTPETENLDKTSPWDFSHWCPLSAPTDSEIEEVRQ